MAPLPGKTCPRCETYKSASEFNKSKRRKDGMQTYCRACQRIRDREHYAKSPKRRRQVAKSRKQNSKKYLREVREYIADYLKTHPCVDCGETNPLTLQFDHVRGKKRRAVSEMLGGNFPVTSVKREVAKCVTRCANCHRRKTATDFGYIIHRTVEVSENE